jgi:hypothetical protein
MSDVSTASDGSGSEPHSVHVVAVATGSALAERVAEQLADAGLTVSGPVAVDAVDTAAVEGAIQKAPGADAVCLIGDPARLAGPLHVVVDSVLRGYGEAWRRDLPAAEALVDQVEAGRVGQTLVFVVPSDADGSERAVQLVVSALSAVERPDAPVAAPAEPVPFGGAAGSSVALAVTEDQSARDPLGRSAAGKASDEADDEPTPPGWQRAVEMLGAEILPGRREELPENIEKLAPVLNVLHTAGEHGTMKLPSGRRYSVWGWPDLRRPTSKVLAVSWGEPIAEVVALHRHPAEAGTCIEEDNGLLPSAGTDVAEVAKRICGRAPNNPDGQLFAISGDAIWILRSRRVFKWDGSREKDDGNAKQVLSSLALHWSNQ